jgi:integrase
VQVWVVDRWWGVDPATGKKTIKKANFGQGVRWQVAHYAEQQNGTRKLVSRNFERAVDAEEYRTRTAHELREGSYRPREITKKTFADAAAAWFSSKKKPTGSSLLRYRDALDIWVLPAWGRRTLSTIHRIEIDEWVTAMMNGTAPHAEGRRVRGNGMAPSGLTAIWVPFKASLAHAVELGWLTSNPVRSVELPKTRPAEKIFLNYHEVEKLIESAREVTGRPADAVAVAVELMAYAGLRIGEVVALEVANVDLDPRRIRIRRTATVNINGSPIFGEPKHGERRDVPIAPHAVEHLRTITSGRSQDAPLIDTARGNYVNLHNWRNRVWSKAVLGAGLQGRQLSPKALRHTAASMAIAAGADVKVVQRMLGHADASMTLNTYADLWRDRLDEVIEAVSAHRERALRALGRQE